MPDQSSAATEHAILQEITAPLESLPDDPLATIEADFPTTLRGYDRVAVDEYVQRTRQLVAELQATRSPEAAVRRALERVGEQISGVLQRAHDTAEEITAQSRSEAEDRLEQGRREAEQMVRAAADRVRELDAETDRIWDERQRIVADAEDLAGRLTDLARVAGERFPSDEEDHEGDEVLSGSGAAADDAALMAGTPVEAGAPQEVTGEHEEPVPSDEQAVFDSDYEPGEPPELELERRGVEDVERTVPFTPLERSEDETSVLQGDADDADDPDDADHADDADDADEVEDPHRADDAHEAGYAEDDSTEGAEDDREPADDVTGEQRQGGSGLTDDDTTRVIRPASQAANRRLGR